MAGDQAVEPCEIQINLRLAKVLSVFIYGTDSIRGWSESYLFFLSNKWMPTHKYHGRTYSHPQNLLFFWSRNKRSTTGDESGEDIQPVKGYSLTVSHAFWHSSLWLPTGTGALLRASQGFWGTMEHDLLFQGSLGCYYFGPTRGISTI